MASQLGQYQPHLRGSGPQAVVVHTFRALWIQTMLVLFVPLVIDFLTLCLLSFSQKPNLKCTKLIKCRMKKKWKVSKVSLQMCKLWVPPHLKPSLPHLKSIPSTRQVLPVRVQQDALFWFHVKFFFFFPLSITQPWTIRGAPPPAKKRHFILTLAG